MISLTFQRWCLCDICLIIITVFLTASGVGAQNPGTLQDTVYCSADRSYFYSLYLPASYKPDSKIPLLILFDPGGNGKYPVNLYKGIAEKWNMAFASSYQSQNGPAATSEEGIYKMILDLRARFPNLEREIILSGFSGGARGVSQLTIADKQFAGVIACGATFPPDVKMSPARKFPYAIVVGNIDMNYLEGVMAAEFLRQISNPVTMISYSGGHTWPPVDKFEQALTWILLKNNRLSQVAIAEKYDRELQDISRSLDSADYLTAGLLATQASSDFANITSTKAVDSLLSQIEKEPEYVETKEEYEKTLRDELEWKKKFDIAYQRALAIAHTDTAFKQEEWRAFMFSIGRLRSSKSLLKRQEAERLHDFSWRRCSEPGGIFYQTQRWNEAMLLGKIWTALEPKNIRPWIRMARISVKMGDNRKAVQHLKKAVDLGFRDKNFMQKDPTLAVLKDEPSFQKLLSRMK